MKRTIFAHLNKNQNHMFKNYNLIFFLLVLVQTLQGQTLQEGLKQLENENYTAALNTFSLVIIFLTLTDVSVQPTRLMRLMVDKFRPAVERVAQHKEGHCSTDFLGTRSPATGAISASKSSAWLVDRKSVV